MAIEFDCPHCRLHYRLKDELAGKAATCKSCRNKIVIPNPVTVPLDAEAAEAAALAALADDAAQVKEDAARRAPKARPSPRRTRRSSKGCRTRRT
jgi:hypothetical protein